LTQKRILIAYGSRYHTTAETAGKLALFLQEERNLNVSLFNLCKVKEISWPLLEREEFDGIIVGTGIRVGKWTKEVKQFVKINKKTLKDPKTLFGLFISCGYASDPKHYPIAVKQFIEAKFEELKFFPDISEVFGGVFDFSPTSSLNSLDKQILKWGARNLVMKIDYSKRNDYRDWDRIYSFGKTFEIILNSS
jgi:menaquinone-dependent protoporphyrinogen oxidase